MRPLDRLRHHVTGAIERGEAHAIVEQSVIVGNEYTYHTASGQSIRVFIVQDCGMVNGQYMPWHKVYARPIGMNNCPLMILDLNTLTAI